MADSAASTWFERHGRRGLGTWLVREAAEWLKLARLERLLAYARPDESEQCHFLERVGFRELVSITMLNLPVW